MSNMNRRDFLKAGAAAATTVALAPGLSNAMELKLGGQNFHAIRTVRARDRKPYLCTMCPYFDGGFAYSLDGKVCKAEGNPDHVATRGRFCTKGLASHMSAYDPDRILTPLKRVGPRGSGKWQEISWDDAIAEVSQKVQQALGDSGANSIYLNEGAFKEGACVRFMDTLGSQSVMRSRLPAISNATKQAALKQAFGVDFLLPDLENSKYVLSFGANIVETAYPLAQRLTDGIVKNRLKLVAFDVRMSNTAGMADEWIPVFPGSDGLIALAMANVIMQNGLADTQFIDTWTDTTSSQLAEHLKQFTPAMAQKASGVPAKTIERIAIEFAEAQTASVVSQNGVSFHAGGLQAEMGCLLLAVITGNIDRKGGNCLPRQMNIAAPQPVPEATAGSTGRLNHAFPFELKEGSHTVKVLFNHMSNPAYSSPAASVWREVLKDEKLIPYLVEFSPFMSETAELADIILPDVVDVERHDIASSPTNLLPWTSMGMPGIKAQGEAKDVRVTLKRIISAIDADGSRGMKQYWAFSNPKDYVLKQVEATEGLDKKSYKKLKKSGVWPNYGKLDLQSRNIVKGKKPVAAEYGTYKASGFATASGKIELTGTALLSWQQNPRSAALKPDEFMLSTHKVAFHTLSRTANNKHLSELWHANPVWINKQIAQQLKVEDGGLIRVTSDAGYLVTKAWLTQGIHPQVIGISTSVGHTAYGRVAKADPHNPESHAKAELEDQDINHNLWWRDNGTNPNDIIPVAIDPQTGNQAWNDTVVRISPAEPGDNYGDIKVDNDKHLAIYKSSTGKA